MGKGNAKSKKQMSRESALRKLTAGIVQARKAADEIQKISESAKRKAVSKPAPSPYGAAALQTSAASGAKAFPECTADVYSTYLCICNRLKMLKFLLDNAEETAKQLSVTHSMLN